MTDVLKRLACATIALTVAFAEPAGEDQSGDIIAKYLSAQELQRSNMRGVEMDVEIDAAIPRLAKKGKMMALRAISKVGRVTYDFLKFDGDNTVKKDVIARYLATEAQASETPDPALAINPTNYKFKYKGEQLKDARNVLVLELNPRRKAVGLFKGEIWLDPETCLPLRESGRFVKSPSVFLKKIEFVREYQVRDGIAVPTRMSSFADTRIVGRTELNVSYSNFHRIADAGEGSSAGVQ
ncbi:MAG: hypothetical protein SFV18_15615 [Bryobacteraceae bacterium]|nr:hypothetical protein [Bryobacteraceae bacterium]